MVSTAAAAVVIGSALTAGSCGTEIAAGAVTGGAARPSVTATAPIPTAQGVGVAAVVTAGARGSAGVLAGERYATVTTAQNFDGSQRPMPAALYSAIVEHFPASEVANAIAIARCETGFTWSADLVSSDGARGSFQVLPSFHGAVPADYDGQARQAAAIVRANGGWGLWSCNP